MEVKPIKKFAKRKLKKLSLNKRNILKKAVYPGPYKSV